MQAIAVIGANGQLGADIVETLREGYTVFSLNHDSYDITKKESFTDFFAKNKVDWVINTAAFHNVELCESDPEKSFQVNAIGAKNIAELALEQNASVIHISTDYVFGGTRFAKAANMIDQRPYVESDAPDPVNVYGASKLAGEHLVRMTNANSSILRVSGIYGTHPCRAKGGRNFVEKVIDWSSERPELKFVCDEFVSPTPTIAIARQIARLIEHPIYGVLHTTTQGFCSWYEFAKTILEVCNIKTPIIPVTAQTFPSKVKRPSFSVLENFVLKKENFDFMPFWKDGLLKYLTDTKRI